MGVQASKLHKKKSRFIRIWIIHIQGLFCIIHAWIKSFFNLRLLWNKTDVDIYRVQCLLRQSLLVLIKSHVDVKALMRSIFRKANNWRSTKKTSFNHLPLKR